MQFMSISPLWQQQLHAVHVTFTPVAMTGGNASCNYAVTMSGGNDSCNYAVTDDAVNASCKYAVTDDALFNRFPKCYHVVAMPPCSSLARLTGLCEGQ